MATLYVICALFCFGMLEVSCSDDPCLFSEIAVQENFNISKYIGTWYELMWKPSAGYNVSNGLFSDFHWVLSENEDISTQIDIAIRARSNNVTTAAEADCIEWQGRYLDLDDLDSGKMVYNNTNEAGIERLYQHLVLATDYTTFAVTYLCLNVGDDDICQADTLEAYIWTREPGVISDATRTTAASALSDACVSVGDMVNIEQKQLCYPAEGDTSSGAGLPKFRFTCLVLSFLLTIFALST